MALYRHSMQSVLFRDEPIFTTTATSKTIRCLWQSCFPESHQVVSTAAATLPSRPPASYHNHHCDSTTAFPILPSWPFITPHS
jgi:hypothetical protein